VDEPLREKPSESNPLEDQSAKSSSEHTDNTETPLSADHAQTPVSETPQAATQPPVEESPKVSSSAGIIILQWLTYAFWGWTLLSLVWLIFIVMASVLTSIDTSFMVPYAIAAVMVLLPLSVACDVFYGKREPAKKIGASMVVMVIHAVIFALFGIGLLIGGVLTVVQTAIGLSSDNDYQIVWIITSFASALIYAVTFLRTLNPHPKLQIAKYFPLFMTFVIGALIIAGFVGPVAQANLTKDDRTITSTISDVSGAIRTYTDDNNKLPAELGDVSLSGEAKDAVDRGLFRYKAEGPVQKETSTKSNNSKIDVYPYSGSNEKPEFRYQLCVTYKKADKSNRYDSSAKEDEYSLYASTYGHPEGDVCYKLSTPSY
jgi:hypothetical protein